MDSNIARTTEQLVNVVTVFAVAILADAVFPSTIKAQQMVGCAVLAPTSFTAIAAAFLLLTFGHRLSFRAPGIGGVPITAQTFVICFNGLIFSPLVSLTACGLYVACGVGAVMLPQYFANGLGPSVNANTAGYVLGFPVASALMAAQRVILESALSETQRKPGRAALASSRALSRAFSMSANAQFAVLACGATWALFAKGLGVPATLRTAVWPYLPGLLLKSAAASIAVTMVRMASPTDALAAQCV